MKRLPACKPDGCVAKENIPPILPGAPKSFVPLAKSIPLGALAMVEEARNILRRNQVPALSSMLGPGASVAPEEKQMLVAVDAQLRTMQKGETAVQFIDARIRELGYIKKSGKSDTVRFYTDIGFDSKSWSAFCNNTRENEQKTVLRIMFGLRLPSVDSERFLHLCGKSFRPHDARDDYCKAILHLAEKNPAFYEPQTIHFILKEFGGHGREFDSIYSDSMF